jgi:glycosyltransferase involved in cell wall biosynthesis
VVQRLLYGLVLDAIAYWRARGKTVVADFDDAYDLIPACNSGHAYWAQGMARVAGNGGQDRMARLDVSPMEEFRRGLRMVSAATVPSRLLVTDWQEQGSVFYLPNSLDLDLYNGVARPPRRDGEVVVGWGGSNSHQESLRLSGVLEALGRVCAQRPSVRIVLAGADPETFAMLPVPAERKTHLPFVKFQDWPKSLAQIDIGLAPLFGEFDQRRSWIKAAEYMAMRIPWVGSKGAPYADLQEFGTLVDKTPEDWAAALLRVLDNLPSYQALADGPGALQAQMMGVDLNAERILMIYEEILDLDQGGPGTAQAWAACQRTPGIQPTARISL